MYDIYDVCQYDAPCAGQRGAERGADSGGDDRHATFFRRGPPDPQVQSLTIYVQILTINKLGFNQIYCAFPLLFLIKMVLWSKFR